MLPVMPATSSAALLVGALGLPQGLFESREDLLLAFGFTAEGGDEAEDVIAESSEDEESDEDEDEDDEDEDDENDENDENDEDEEADEEAK